MKRINFKKKIRTIRDFWLEDFRAWRHEKNSKPLLQQLKEVLDARRTYGFFPEQYFRYRAYKKEVTDFNAFLPRKLLARTQSLLNSGADMRHMKDKRLFRKRLDEGGLPGVREVISIDSEGNIRDGFDRILTQEEAEKSLKDCDTELFVKPLTGAFGEDASIFHPEDDPTVLLQTGGWIIQPRIVQHASISKLYSKSVNTVRIDTLLDESTVKIGRAILRIGAGGSIVDNGAAGGLTVAIQLETGRISSCGIREQQFDNELTRFEAHPDTGAPFLNTTVPFWPEVQALVLRAARQFSEFRTVGWDIVITPSGPIILEANNNWGFELMQMHWPMRDTALGQAAVKASAGG